MGETRPRLGQAANLNITDRRQVDRHWPSTDANCYDPHPLSCPPVRTQNLNLVTRKLLMQNEKFSLDQMEEAREWIL